MIQLGLCVRIFLSIFLIILSKVKAETNGIDSRTLAKSHESLKAYPNAIISLKDPNTERIFYVESNGRHLVAFEKSGSVLWSIDVLDTKKNTPILGKPVIRHIKLENGRIIVTIAKHDYAEIQPSNGMIKFLGSD